MYHCNNWLKDQTVWGVLIISVAHSYPGSVKHIINSTEMYQQVLGPGHTLCRWQTQSDWDEAQHRLPDPRGPVFGLWWPILVLVLLWGQSLDRSVAGQRPTVGWGRLTKAAWKLELLGPWSCKELLKVRRGVYCEYVESFTIAGRGFYHPWVNKGRSKPTRILKNVLEFNLNHEGMLLVQTSGKWKLAALAMCYRRAVQEYFSHRGHRTDTWVENHSRTSVFIPRFADWVGRNFKCLSLYTFK